MHVLQSFLLVRGYINSVAYICICRLVTDQSRSSWTAQSCHCFSLAVISAPERCRRKQDGWEAHHINCQRLKALFPVFGNICVYGSSNRPGIFCLHTVENFNIRITCALYLFCKISSHLSFLDNSQAICSSTLGRNVFMGILES